MPFLNLFITSALCLISVVYVIERFLYLSIIAFVVSYIFSVVVTRSSAEINVFLVCVAVFFNSLNRDALTSC